MKSLTLVVLLGLVAGCSGVASDSSRNLHPSTSAAAAADSSRDYNVESRNRMETFTSRISKIYEFKDDGISYVAYVVTWRGHEVVVQPALLDSEEKHHAVGEVIRCSMMQHVFSGRDGKAITHTTFMAAPTRFLRPTDPTGFGDSGRVGDTMQQRHLDALSSEFNRAQSARDLDQSTQAPQPTVTPPSK